MGDPLTLREIADKADAYAEHLRDADSLRFALRNMAMLVREHLPAAPAAETREPASRFAGVRHYAEPVARGSEKTHPGRVEDCKRCNFGQPAPAPEPGRLAEHDRRVAWLLKHRPEEYRAAGHDLLMHDSWVALNRLMSEVPDPAPAAGDARGESGEGRDA